MTATSFLNALAPVAGTRANRAAREIARADVVNRIYVVAMFVVIIAIGACGAFAIVQSEDSDQGVAQRFELANDVSAMGSALDREDDELQSQLRQRQGLESERLVRATEMFDAARLKAEKDGSTSTQHVLSALVPRQAAYVSDSRDIAGALAAGDIARAGRIDTLRVRPNVDAMRHVLDAMSARLYRESIADAATDRALLWKLQRIILCVTCLGVVLMGGFAALLGWYKRRAYRAAGATLTALEAAATTDHLTKLGNNRSFYDDFEREIARAKRYGHSLVLALVDVDDFKAVNDKGGHSFGDSVLAGVGKRLRNTRQEDRAYRIGGDEFAVLLVETDPVGAGLALARLQSEIRESGLGATVSIGYVNLSGDQLSLDSYELADTALYEAKRLGRNQTVCFKTICGTANVYSPRKADAVRRMIAQGLVSTAFQPIWDMQSARPLGFEALARPLPELGLSGPQEAFDVAQRIRQLPELDMICTRKALDAAGNLPAGSVIFLNYSPASLTHGSFTPQAFVAMARAAGFLPEQIVVELTERRIEDPALVAQRVTALRALGIRVALDDTGSGHAGLEVLSKVRFDFVKIDRQLIIEAMQHREARGVLAGIIAIARETNSYLIAEGIETGEMLDFIRNAHAHEAGAFAGVRGIQGYFLGKPELGRINLGALEEHHDFLAARQGLELRRAMPRQPAAALAVL